MTDEPWIEIYRAKDAVEAHLVADALDDAGIRSLIDGETLGSSFAALPLGWTTAPRILVPPDEVQRAKGVLEQLRSAGEE
jgi:Putative prokaryotic signal transducing protein